jgi:PAS domain S-box-containing protein
MSLLSQPEVSAAPAAPSQSSGTGHLLEHFIDGIADFAYMKDLEGRYIAVNRAAAAFLGRTPAEVIGNDDFALMPPEQARKVVEADRAVLAGSDPLKFEEEMVLGGRTTYLQTVKSVCRDAAGKPIGIVGISRDIGDRKQLENALRERDLDESQRIAGLGTWRYHCATGVTIWSNEIYRIYGLDPGRPANQLGEFFKRSDHSPSEKQFIQVFRRAVEFGEPYSVDLQIRRHDGATRWIAARGEVDEWVDGKVASLRGTVHDITERKLQEQQLALSENRYRSLVHASSQIVWITGADGNQRGTIPGWQAFTGQSDEEVLGFGWAGAIHPDDRERTTQLWREAVASGRPFLLEQRLRRADGVYRDMAVHAAPVLDASGTIVEWVGTHTDITEQKQARIEMQAAHQRLENVLNSITDGLAVLDRDWRYTYYNENGARITGRNAAEIVGTRLGDVFTENKTNGFGAAYRRAVETGQATQFEGFYGPPLNKWFECNCYPSADGLTVYFRDVTSRKQIEQRLRDSESRYRKLFESNMIGIARPDRFGAFKEGNGELLRIVGYTREDLEAGLVRWDTMTPPEYAHLDAAHIAEAAERGSCTPYEKEYIRKDGTRVPILCGYALLEGSTDEYIGFVIDLTRQRAAEAALREREQRFRLLSESLPELVWMTDQAGSVVYLNQRFLDYCGISPEEVPGYDPRNFLHPEEYDRVHHSWLHSIRTGEPFLIEQQMRSHAGEFRYFLARALPLRNDAGEIERWVGSCTDVHDRRLAEEALRRSEKLAATGRLAASIAHEINNPLESVTNALYLALQDASVSPETRNYLEIAQDELARVSHITTQTLRFHRQSKAAAFANLTDIMQSVLSLFRGRLVSRNIEVVAECDPVARICCFADEIRQVFANLVSNSLDATPDRGRLRIRIRNVSAFGEPGVRVTVADTGCGIPEKIQKRIFEPFFSTKDNTGIGLGLWVSDGILRKHHGRIRLQTSTAPHRHGTVFSLFFPHNTVPSDTIPTSPS